MITLRSSATSRLALVAALASSSALIGAVGCSGAGATNLVDEPLPENTGAISARLASAPADVQCVEIHTSDYRNSTIYIDVVPGQSTTKRIAPVSTGYVQIWGAAYNRPCNSYPYPYPYPTADAGVEAVDGGPSSYGGDAPTWEADPTYVNVQAGQTTQATLRFHQPGSLDVTIDWDNCDPNTNWSCGTQDGGPVVIDAGPDFPEADAGPTPPPSVDGGPIQEGDAGAPN